MRKIIILIIFIFFAPLNLALSLMALTSKSPVEKISSAASSQLYASLPQDTGVVLGSFSTADARPLIIVNYLSQFNSPFLPYVDLLMKAADRYQVDYRLIIAIAQCESNLCKKSPPNSYNCWGFENGETKFNSWENAFNQVAKTLREGYLDKGLLTPEEIMAKYAPPSVAKGGPWAKCVNQFISDLEHGRLN